MLNGLAGGLQDNPFRAGALCVGLGILEKDFQDT